MTILTNPTHAINMADWNLNAIKTGVRTKKTPAEVDIVAGTMTFVFSGAGLTYSGGDPVSGTITKLVATDSSDGSVLTISGFSLTAATVFGFVNANDVAGLQAALFAGNDTLNGSTQNDVLYGYGGADTFNLGAGGVDVAIGGAGADTFNLGAVFTAADKIDGGADADRLVLVGDYSGAHAVAMTPTTLVNVETIALGAGHSYTLTTADATVGVGAVLAVNGAALGATSVLTFNGAAETNGRFAITGGAGSDVLTGGAGADTFNLSRGGADKVKGGAGADTFIMGGAFGASDSIDGGAGADALALAGDYSASFDITSSMLQNVETILLGAGHGYNLRLHDGVIANGAALTINGASLGVSDALDVDGGAIINANTSLVVYSGVGGANFIAGPGRNVFHGGAANDNISFLGNFDKADSIDGGGGTNVLDLSGDYSAGLTVTPTMVKNINYIGLASGHSYKLAIGDIAIAPGQGLGIVGSSLGASDSLIFDGAAETTGRLMFYGGAGANWFRGGAGDDSIMFTNAPMLKATDHIDGGAGYDTATLSGDYSAGLTFAATTMVGVEQLTLWAGHSYKVTTNNATVAAGQTFTVDAKALGAGDPLVFNGGAEVDGKFSVWSGAGADALGGGANADTISGGGGADALTGGRGADQLTGGAGADRFVYRAANEGGDTISDFSHAQGDTIWISHAGFGAGLPASGALAANRFVVDHAPTQAFGQFLWNTTTDTLSWDADGTAAGAAVKIATLTGLGGLTNADIRLY